MTGSDIGVCLKSSIDHLLAKKSDHVFSGENDDDTSIHLVNVALKS